MSSKLYKINSSVANMHKSMKLVQKNYIESHNPNYPVIDELSNKAKNLFNVVNYHITERFLATQQYIGFSDLYNLLKQEEAYKDLPTKVSKQIVKRISHTWKKYIKAHKDWTKNPHKYRNEPKRPHDLNKDEGRYLVIYPLDAISRPALKEGTTPYFCR